MIEKTIITEGEYNEITHEENKGKEEANQKNTQLIKIEEDGKKDIIKYFDRIHDKLFAFNNILIGGYFALIKIDESTPSFIILIPISNLCLLVYIEYMMMEKGRFESKIRNKPEAKIQKWKQDIKKITNYSLTTIVTTLFVVIVFLVFLF